MQTDCQTEVERDRQMNGKINSRMRETNVPRMTALEEKKKVTSHKGPRICHT